MRGCPLVAGIGSLLEHLGEWVDKLLQPLVLHLPGFIQDTETVLSQIHNIHWAHIRHQGSIFFYPSMPAPSKVIHFVL